MPDVDWSRHCWSKRFTFPYGPCAKPAKWRGPGRAGTIDGEWRACDEHRQATDVPLLTPTPIEQPGGETC